MPARSTITDCLSGGFQMYCPTCGAADQSASSYCRKCGEWLADRTGRGRKHTPGDKLKAISVFSGLNSLFSLVSAIILYATYLGTPAAKWSIYVAGAFCTVIAVHQAISFAFALSLIIRDRRRRIEPGYQQVADVTGQLESGSQFTGLPSVTEKTTELLPENDDADSRSGTTSRSRRRSRSAERHR
ncbi:MAG TPA: hypothetical protein VFV34_06560 [Blastocatellia bacterium]|nr:hypothetical protein [Blastocatellia bacterium]